MNRESFSTMNGEIERSKRYECYEKYRPVNMPNIDTAPYHWAAWRLKDTAKINTEKVNECSDGENEIEYVDIGNVSLVHGITCCEKLRFKDAPSRARRLVRDGDTIISTVRTYLKAVAYIESPPPNLVVSTGFAVLRPNPELIHPKYLYRMVQSEPFIQEVAAASVGVSYPAINPSDLAAFPILAPPLPEQHAIANFLDRETAKIDVLIAKKRRLIELLQEKREAVSGYIVTKGLSTDAELKPSRIPWFGKIPVHWTVERLGWVCQEINDINHEMPESVREGIAFLSAKDLLDDGTLNFTDEVKRISVEDYERLSNKIRPRVNDIVYSRIGACLGKARIVETHEPFQVSYSCCIVRVDPRCACPRFFRHLLDTDLVLTEARMRTQGIGVPDLGLREIKRFPVPFPPLNEQREIGRYLEAKTKRLRELIQRIDDAIRNLSEYRSALISAAVTGKIDVRNQ